MFKHLPFGPVLPTAYEVLPSSWPCDPSTCYTYAHQCLMHTHSPPSAAGSFQVVKYNRASGRRLQSFEYTGTQGPQYSAISAKCHPGDPGNLLWCVVRAQGVVSWRKWDFTCKAITERYICRVILDKEKPVLNISLPLYMPRDIILDWVPLAGSLATAPLSWPTLERWRWSLYELERQVWRQGLSWTGNVSTASDAWAPWI